MFDNLHEFYSMVKNIGHGGQSEVLTFSHFLGCFWSDEYIYQKNLCSETNKKV